MTETMKRIMYMMLHSKAGQFSVGYSLKSKKIGLKILLYSMLLIIGNNLFAFTKTSF
jgi:hypothetical protein